MQRIRNIIRRNRVKRFKKGEPILRQGDTPSSAFIVKSGIVKVYNLTRDGDERPIGFYRPDDVFPLAWVLEKVREAQYYYEAFDDCRLQCVSPSEFLAHLCDHPDKFVDVMRRLVEGKMGFEMRINALGQSKASRKIVNVLHYLCLQFGEELKEDTVEVKIALTQQDLANMTGLTRETTGLELKKLQKQGVITCRRRHYIVSTNKLNELIDEDYGQGVIGHPQE